MRIRLNKVRPQAAKTLALPRAVANELVLLSALCHVFVADVSSDWLPEVFATDSSEEKGAVVRADLSRDASRVLWGASLGPSSSARLLSKERAALMRVDRFFEEPLEGPPKVPLKRPLALRLHFLEVCDGLCLPRRAYAACFWFWLEDWTGSLARAFS